MTLDGYGTEQIATIFSEEKILTPIAYWREKGVNRPGKSKLRGPYMWNSSTITHILSLQEYCGDILNFKTYSKSYKNKKRLANDRENWVIFQDVHEAIIERAVLNRSSRSGVRSASAAPTKGNAICSPAFWSALIADTTCTSISIRATPTSSILTAPTTRATVEPVLPPIMSVWTSLEQVVLGEIRRLTKFASQFEDEFVKAVIGHSQQAEATGPQAEGEGAESPASPRRGAGRPV